MLEVNDQNKTMRCFDWMTHTLARRALKAEAVGQINHRNLGAGRMKRQQFRRRFGPLDDVTQTRIATADPVMLNRWADAILTATTIEEVLATQH